MLWLGGRLVPVGGCLLWLGGRLVPVGGCLLWLGGRLVLVGGCLLWLGGRLTGLGGFPLSPDEFRYRMSIPLHAVHSRWRELGLGLRGSCSGRSRLQVVDPRRRLLDVLRWSFRRLRLAVSAHPLQELRSGTRCWSFRRLRLAVGESAERPAPDRRVRWSFRRLRLAVHGLRCR